MDGWMDGCVCGFGYQRQCSKRCSTAPPLDLTHPPLHPPKPRTHPPRINQIVIDSAGARIISASSDDTAKVWGMDGRQYWTMAGHGATGTTGAVSGWVDGWMDG